MTFDEGFHQRTAAAPRIGKTHVIYCLDLYQRSAGVEPPVGNADVTATIAAHLRKTSLVPVLSDFLFGDAERVLQELKLLNAAHDVFLMMVDARFAYQLPDMSAGWIETFDIETGSTRLMSRRELSRVGTRVGEWQDHVRRIALDAGLDLLTIGSAPGDIVRTMVEFVAERRLRKT
jgi:hypothetical protein